MTAGERAAYNAGIKAAINAAQTVAVTTETAYDANTFLKKVAADTLGAFAESTRGLMLADQTDASTPMKENNISLSSGK
jgi:hypothetical protein